MNITTKLSFKDLLDQTKRKLYVTDDVVASVEPSDEQELEFISLGKYVSAADLESELAKQGYELAHPYALALYAKEHPDFADNKYIATQWKDKDGEFCCAAFFDWVGGRGVSVFRYSDEWFDDWLFACLRKHPALGHSVSSPLSFSPSEPITLNSALLSDFIDEEYPKGHKDRGAAMLYTAQFIVWMNKNRLQ